jgi:hypothetical protein
MGMPASRLPAPPGHRRRRSRSQNDWRVLDRAGRAGRPPALPAKKPAWLKSTRKWWATVWASPMAAMYIDADMGALVRLARLQDDLAAGRLPPSTHAMVTQLEDRFGLTPRSRQQLMWQIAPHEPVIPARPDGRNVHRLQAVDPFEEVDQLAQKRRQELLERGGSGSVSDPLR